ncbi:MAG: DotA/TraY family protein [Rhodospirillales bacterium]|nr:DotA/TraY family protein [Alphaproteobacteria bacterium]MCB1840213.1 DotA/TraY family protein [Alphaproteobacteria bacterium]MCB9977241.1 DotA/TraY family protein [Rhodospirillales bacterium]
MLTSIIPRGSFRYMVMPELVSRINSLVMGGFHYIPFFIALVYQIVRLLPPNHPYVNPANIGRFGVRHVIAEAANNLVVDLKNIDKIVLFVLVIFGLAILFLQVVLLILALLFPSVLAFPVNWDDFFVVNPVAERRQDLAFMMLDMVFGVPHPNALGVTEGFFESCIAVNIPCEDNFGNPITDINVALTPVPPALAPVFDPLSTQGWTVFPWPIHLGLHRLFAVYSMGLLVIAVFIAGYFIATILAETAQSGTAFGRRFNKVWAPLRIVMAFGLLIPLNVGINSSQYLVLFAAKFGSAFATNGWKYFNRTLTVDYLGGASDLVATPTLPDVSAIGQAMFLIRTCKFAYQYARRTPPDIRMWHVLAQGTLPQNAYEVVPGYTFDNAQDNAQPLTTNLTVRFGERNVTEFPTEQGHVKPYCGEIQFSLADPRRQSAVAPDTPPEPGPYQVQNFFWELIKQMWHDTGTAWDAFQNGAVTVAGDRADSLAWVRFNKVGPPPGPLPDAQYVSEVNKNVYDFMQAEVVAAVAAQIASGRWVGSWTGVGPLYRKGWAAAGIWYNRIAEMNHPIMVSVRALPAVSLYPLLLEELKKKKAQYNANTSPMDVFKPSVAGVDDTQTLLSSEDGQEIASVLNEAYQSWTSALGTTRTQSTGNAFLDTISNLLGTNGLYDLRNNPTTHPLAQLASVGRSLVESSVQTIGASLVASLGGIGALLAGAQEIAKPASVFAQFAVTIAMIGLTAGFVLAYVVPFLPFIYFFFAVGGWIKGIFEAMVGAPLWALAHIRIDAQGLPGNAALNGYFLIFEIFLRPILCVFGLLASISIYSALVSALNVTFELAVHNLGGFDVSAEVAAPPANSFIDWMRGPIDEFFLTVIYAVLVYMMGMSSFKLIDTIPNNILRWMGQSVATFGDMQEDPAQGLVGRAAFGAQQVTGKLGGGLGALAKLGNPG